MKKWILLLALLIISSFYILEAQDKTNKPKQPIEEIKLPGLKWRNIGPAITSGRISDIAVHPDNPYLYYVATSSGGVWKTENAGVTYKPLFDAQGSYSIGCIAIDPINPNVIWVGTGENNNQRSVAYGDGIYKSEDGGKTWKHMGLKTSEHIGKIIVHPQDNSIVYVAAIGPLWSKGGDRGVYKTTDQGKTWNKILEVDVHTGANDIIMDPRNPDILYASMLQRRRHVYTYVGGGPGSGLYKTTDGGVTWNKSQNGLPSVELGRIGLAMSPADPEYIYAIVEAAQGKGGFFLSNDQGASWNKQSSHSTSGNYYQEIICDPADPHTIYSMDTWMKVSHDGGKSFKNVGEDTKHVDNHSMWINPHNTDHWLVGCDGGIYETFDAASTWDFKENLPVTQFYKVAVDNDLPFYNVYGGTQDNFSMGGPSRVETDHGITNADWFITHGGDGFESQVDPFNPDIVYAQSQYGVLVRYDRKSGEELGIQPKERKGENAYRWNWDAPLAVSAHKKGRLFFAANKVFRSDDYGNSWEVISDDLSRQLDRNTLKVYDRVVSIDAIMKNGSTSPYGTIVAFNESTLEENLIAAGTDDGLIQISEDGGASWRKIDNVPGAPRQSYVNSLFFSQHDRNTVYAAFNHHKYGDFKPYIFISQDLGRSWKSISSNLPSRGSVYSIEEDHIDSGLIFCGTEFGVFFSPNRGGIWKKLGAGLPTIAVRDIAIQRRESDLVLATFGRGFYVMDDYSALRNVENQTKTQSEIYATRDALMWESSKPLGLPGKSFQGDNYYSAENLGPEAMITFYYHAEHDDLKKKRLKEEKKNIKEGRDTPYPSYDDLKAEEDFTSPQILVSIEDIEGNVVKNIKKKASPGIHRIKWNLRFNPKDPVNLNKPSFYNPFAGVTEGTLVQPGNYVARLSVISDDQITSLSLADTFAVRPLKNNTIAIKDREEKVAFQQEVNALSADMQATQRMMREVNNKLRHIDKAIMNMDGPLDELYTMVASVKSKSREITTMMNGDRIKSRLDIDQPPTPGGRLGWITYEQKYSTADVTETHKMSFKIAKEEFIPIQQSVLNLVNIDLKNLEKKLKEMGAPYTPGRITDE